MAARSASDRWAIVEVNPGSVAVVVAAGLSVVGARAGAVLGASAPLVTGALIVVATWVTGWAGEPFPHAVASTADATSP
jgi:hypothetical protein